MKTLEITEKPVSSLPEFFFRIFKFLASLKLAICVLAALMAVLATGTILESLHGTDAARLLVYDSVWFGVVLFLLGINVAAAALDRLPWKKKHTGFVITHIGILLVLTGSFITRSLMIDGQMAIAEGETEYRITLPDPQLFVVSETQMRPWIFSLKKHPFAWSGRETLGTTLNGRPAPFPIFRLTDYPKARMNETIETAMDGPPAVQLKLTSSFVEQTQWLIKDHATLGQIQMGPAKFSFSQERLKESKKTASPEQSYLEFQFSKSQFNFPLSADLQVPAEFQIDNTPYRARILRLFKNAVVVGKELKEESANKKGDTNPAAELVLLGAEGFVEKHTVFAKFPDFPTVHGLQPSKAGAKIFYRLPGAAGSRGQSHELRFVENGEGLIYQIQKGLEIKTGKTVMQEEVPLGWMDMKFKIENYYPHAKIQRRFSPQPETSQSEEDQPAIQIETGTGSEKKQIWLRQGEEDSFSAGGEKYRVAYGQRRMPAGFKLTLRDFRVQNYPGTNRPASFESDVTLRDDMAGVIQDATISMNKPLVYRGFYIYQAGYSLPGGVEGETPQGGEVSIFSVGRDPGVPVKYAGAIVMVIGTLTMFYLKKFSSTIGKVVG